MAKPVAFIVFSYVFGICETLVHSARLMAEAGIEVDIFIDQNSFSLSPPPLEKGLVRVIPLDPEPDESVDQARLFAENDLFTDFLEANRRFPKFPLFLKKLHRAMAEREYGLLIGVEPFGLIAAHLMRATQTAPLVYYNLELYQRSNCDTPEAHLIKDMEIQASRECVFTVIPDRERGAVFSRANDIPEERLRYLPISSSGLPLKEKTDYFRRHFSIPEDHFIALYAGNLADWAYCREMAAACDAWPDNVELVIHTWRPNMENDPYCREVKAAAGARVHLSLEPLERDVFLEAVSSADIGLAFYKPIDENFLEVGSSSGKLSLYFRAGLPAVASDFSSISQVLNAYGCGLCVEGPEDAGPALEILTGDLETYRAAAFDAYERHYCFDTYFSSLLDEFATMLKN